MVTDRLAASASFPLSPTSSPVPDMQGGGGAAPRRGTYETQKRRDWHSFGQYLRTTTGRRWSRRGAAARTCSTTCATSTSSARPRSTRRGAPSTATRRRPRCARARCSRPGAASMRSSAACTCATFDEHGGLPEANPFRARVVRLYLCEVRNSQAMARGIAARRGKKSTAAGPGPVESTHVSTVPDPATDCTEY